MEQIKQDVADIKRALIGDEELGIVGLVKRQEADEAWQKEVDKKMDENHRLLKDHDEKLSVIYPAFSVIRYVGRAKKQIIIFWSAIGSAALFIWHKFEDLWALIKQ